MSTVGGTESNRDRFNNPLKKPSNEKTEGHQWNAEFTNEKDQGVKVEDFLNLMVAQLANQDFMNPTDDTQYLAQLAQFASMQQMQELAAYSKSNYVMSMIGKEVTAARFNVSGNLETVTGPVERITLADNEYTLYVDGDPYTLEEIMEIYSGEASKEEGKIDPSKMSITPGAKTDSTIDLSWEVPTKDTAAASRLTYTVYYSTEGPFDTVEEVEKGFAHGEVDRKNLTKETLTGLNPDTTYYINVVVTDSDGNKKTYKSLVVRTENPGESSGGTEEKS